MSGTSSSLATAPQKTLTLPVPSIGLADPVSAAGTPLNPASLEYSRATDGTKIFMHRMPIFSAVELTHDILASDLRLELLWYRRVTRTPGVDGIGSGYHHPAHFPLGDPALDSPLGGSPVAPMLPPSRSRGGRRDNPGVATFGLRSEWSVTANGQRFFIDTLGDFLVPSGVQYLDTTGSQAIINTFTTSNRAGTAGNSVGGGYFGYARKLRPNYFAFRFSVTDPKDARSRLNGPISRVIKMSHAVHPFYADDGASQAFQRAANRVNPNYRPDFFNVWFETSLPSNG